MNKKGPPWDKGIKKLSFPKLKGEIETDVLIIGGGITGILTGFYLTKSGFQVTLVEKDKLCQGATGLTTAFLTKIIDTDATDLIEMFGKKKAQLILESHEKSIDFIEDIINEEKIDCEFKRCSNYIYANSPEDVKYLKKEDKSLKSLQTESIFSLKPKEGFENAGYLEIKDQAKFHPLKFTFSLASKSKEFGMAFFENTEIQEISKENDSMIAKGSGGRIKAQWIISGTYEPFGEPLNLFFKKGMYKSYIQEFNIEKGLIEEAIYEDTENPYHFFRIDNVGKYDRLLIGGEDNKILFPIKEKVQFKALRSYADKILPGIKKEFISEWSGPILEPGDALAFIGPSHEERMIYAMAFSGNGMTYSGIAAMIIKDLIEGKENIYYDLYRTSRVLRLKPTAMKAKDFTDEFINGVLKNSIKKWDLL